MTPSPHDAVAGPRPGSPIEPLDPPPRRGPLGQLGLAAGRSLFPLVALLIILGTVLWGPWVTLGLTVAWWTLVTRIG